MSEPVYIATLDADGNYFGQSMNHFEYVGWLFYKEANFTYDKFTQLDEKKRADFVQKLAMILLNFSTRPATVGQWEVMEILWAIVTVKLFKKFKIRAFKY